MSVKNSATAQPGALVNRFVAAGILCEMTGRQRHTRCEVHEYLAILERGAKLPCDGFRIGEARRPGIVSSFQRQGPLRVDEHGSAGGAKKRGCFEAGPYRLLKSQTTSAKSIRPFAL